MTKPDLAAAALDWKLDYRRMLLELLGPERLSKLQPLQARVVDLVEQSAVGLMCSAAPEILSFASCPNCRSTLHVTATLEMPEPELTAPGHRHYRTPLTKDFACASCGRRWQEQRCVDCPACGEVPCEQPHLTSRPFSTARGELMPLPKVS